MAKPLKSLAAGAAYLLFLAAFVEVALQAFYFFTAGGFLFARVGRPIFVANEYSGYWNKPNLEMEHNTNEFHTMLYTNGAGFRVSKGREEYSTEKDPSRFRVMLLGPSFAFGWGVDQEDSFAARLETLLERDGHAGGRDVELINAGVPSLLPVKQLQWFQNRGREYRPDLVIQFIYGSMAVETDRSEKYAVTSDGYLVPKGITSSRKLQHTLKQSAIVFYGWVVYTRLRGIAGSGDVEGAGRTLIEQESFAPELPTVAAALEFYEDLRASVEAAGGRLLIVYFPLAYGIHLEDAVRWEHLGVRNVKAQRAFDDEFCRYLRDRGSPCLDITDDLARAARDTGDRLYYWLDIHWTPAGNAVAAESVARALRSNRAATAARVPDAP